MALGRRNDERQGELWIAAPNLPVAPGHTFYVKLNQLLAEAGFDEWVEALCEPCYAKSGRPGIPPGVYFRMLLVGYFEGIGSQRGIAWRCSDSLSLRKFLGMAPTEETPVHASLSVIRERLPIKIHYSVFQWVLKLACEKKLLDGKTLGVDSTTLEANAAMRSIVRRDTEEDWREYVTNLMRAEGVVDDDEEPPVDEIKKFDRKRPNKKVSNGQWKSPTDEDSRIAKMKDGTTHLAYKAEHAVDLKSELIVAAEIYHADCPDVRTLEDTAHMAQMNLWESGSGVDVQDVVADKGYHSAAGLADLAEYTPYRTYIAEQTPPVGQKRVWTDRPSAHRDATYANRRRIRGERGRQLQRLRSEKAERSFAHVCETGGARRTWLRGIEKIAKRYLISAMAHNLGCLMRSLFGMGTPRGLQRYVDMLADILCALQAAYIDMPCLVASIWSCPASWDPFFVRGEIPPSPAAT